MAVESKPLFHPEALRQQVRAFNLPEQTAAWQPKLQPWATLISSGRADEFKETALLPDFLTDIFCGLLGYSGPAEAPDSYTLSPERHVEVDGEFADAALGRFQKGKEQFIAVLEGKGNRQPDRSRYRFASSNAPLETNLSRTSTAPGCLAQPAVVSLATPLR